LTLWISEADVAAAMNMTDAIAAVESGLLAEARGDAENMEKTHVTWDGGSLHAIGARFGEFAGTKTWAHTAGGASPLVILYDRATGALQAVIEAFALGQMRTGAVSGVATRWLAPEPADEMAIIGTGKQAFSQVAAITVVRPLRRVRVYGRDAERRRAFAARVRDELRIEAAEAPSIAEAVRNAPIVTTVTRAREPFLFAGMVAAGAHINAVGAIVPAGAEIAPDLVARARVVVDTLPAARRIARELETVDWKAVRPLSEVVAAHAGRAAGEITLFKSLGMGISDLAMATELFRRVTSGRRAYTFVDRSGVPAARHTPQEPVVITREEIDAEVQRLAGLPAPANGRRVSMIVNPLSGPGNGLAPGTAVSLSVLLPGERTTPVRENASLVSFCIRGRGTAMVAGKRIDFSLYDAWNLPPWSVYQHVNDGDDLQVRLTYSNSALLQKMNVHVVDEDPQEERSAGVPQAPALSEAAGFAPAFLLADGAYLMPYERLISPDVVRMEPLHWPWTKVKEELDKLTGLGNSYVGRRLLLLYNPATGRTNGTSHNFFATLCVRPANIVDRPHRHTASAINYFFKGSGWSVIEGKRYTWKAGDLMLTAPGWAIHNHASNDEDVYELTIQDSPLQIAMGSLLWQEDLRRPPEVLGATGGFATNRAVQEVGSK
jgi:gentisate 1,2-dioxygenase